MEAIGWLGREIDVDEALQWSLSVLEIFLGRANPRKRKKWGINT
jgi:hypothetical protein